MPRVIVMVPKVVSETRKLSAETKPLRSGTVTAMVVRRPVGRETPVVRWARTGSGY